MTGFAPRLEQTLRVLRLQQVGDLLAGDGLLRCAHVSPLLDLVAMPHCASWLGRAPWAERLIFPADGPMPCDLLSGARGPASQAWSWDLRRRRARAPFAPGRKRGGRRAAVRGGNEQSARAESVATAARAGRTRPPDSPCRRDRPPQRPAPPSFALVGKTLAQADSI